MKHYYRATLFALLTALSVGVSAQDNYTLTNDDVVVEDGFIQSSSYSSSQGANLTIPETLDGQTVIGVAHNTVSSMGVFKNKGIKSLTLPSTLETIGGYAFYSNDIDSLDLSACTSLVLIKSRAFKKNSIDSLDLSGCTALETIEDFAFDDSGIKSINFSGCASLTSIGSYCFDDNAIVSIDFTGCIALDYIGGFAFKDASISTLNLSPCTALRSIGFYAFEDGAIESLDLSGCSALTNIGGHSFLNNNIKTLDLSGCSILATIGNGAFSGNAIDTVDLSLNLALVSIGTYAFSSNAFASFVLPSPDISGFSFNIWESSAETVFNGGDTISDFSSSYEAKFGPYTLSDDDVVVVDGVIISCNKTKFNSELTIPEVLDNQTIIGIGNDDEGEYVFDNKNIKGLTLPNTIQTFGSYAFSTNDITRLDLTACTNLTSIGKRAFEKNDIDGLDLSNCNLIKTIEQSAFYSNNIVKLNLDNCSLLTSIGGSAFSSNNIDSLDLSSCTALETIGSYAFSSNAIDSLDLSYCTLLDSIGSYAFNYNDIDSIDLSASTSLTYIGYNAFKSNNISGFALPTPDIVGYTLNNWVDWNDNSYVGGEIVSDLSAAYEAFMLANDYELVFDANGGEGTMESQSISFNDAVNLTFNSFTRTSYTFADWNTAADGSGTSYADEAEFVMNVEGTTLYAQWNEPSGLSTVSISDFTIYPNPAKDAVRVNNIELDSEICIYSISGKLVKQVIATSSNESINVSDFTPGMYIVSLKGENQKLIIE